MLYSTPGASAEFLSYPTHKVVGVFTDWQQARRVIEHLASRGFKPDQIGVLYGEVGAKRLDASGEHHGLLAQISRFFDRFADMDEQHTKRHEQELLAGHVLVQVDSQDESTREEIRRLMKETGGYFINYYGNWFVENLDA